MHSFSRSTPRVVSRLQQCRLSQSSSLGGALLVVGRSHSFLRSFHTVSTGKVVSNGLQDGPQGRQLLILKQSCSLSTTSDEKKQKSQPLQYFTRHNLPKENMYKPVPPEMQKHLPAIETYVKERWLPLFPDGAGIRKLQRDIAWRMKKKDGSPGKLEREVLETILGELLRKGVIGIRPKGGARRAFIITHPAAATNGGESQGNEHDLANDDDDSSSESESDESDSDASSSDSDEDDSNENPGKIE